jgi:hypothetical protein
MMMETLERKHKSLSRRRTPHSASGSPKTADQYDGSTGTEFGCAPAQQFDGVARSIPATARYQLGAIRPAPLIGVAMKPAYRLRAKTTKESARIKF